jgi:hypothetical protein
MVQRLSRSGGIMEQADLPSETKSQHLNMSALVRSPKQKSRLSPLLPDSEEELKLPNPGDCTGTLYQAKNTPRRILSLNTLQFKILDNPENIR